MNHHDDYRTHGNEWFGQDERSPWRGDEPSEGLGRPGIHHGAESGQDHHDTHQHSHGWRGGHGGPRGTGPMGFGPPAGLGPVGPGVGPGGFGPRGRGPRGFGPGGFGPGGFGPGGFGPGGFGPGGERGPRGGGRRGGRAGRGDVRAALLLLLAEEPMHGYQLIQQIVERSGGVWTPSPGSVYPALQQLEDEGLIAFERVSGRKTASLTADGRTYLDAHRADLGSPWDDVSGGVSSEVRDLRELVGGLMAAVHQVASIGTPAQAAQAATVLGDARRSMYRILAESEDPAAT